MKLYVLFLSIIASLLEIECSESFEPSVAMEAVKVINQSDKAVYTWREEVYGSGRIEIVYPELAMPHDYVFLRSAGGRSLREQMLYDSPKIRLDTINVYISHNEDDFLKWFEQRTTTSFNDTTCFHWKCIITKENINLISFQDDIYRVML